MIEKEININNKIYIIEKLLGKGKGGYTYLAYCNEKPVALKQIHYEKCDYYAFEKNKLTSELRDYKTLKALNITVPRLIDYNDEKQILIKELIPGKTAAHWVANGLINNNHILQLINMANILKENNLNIDYFPTNFMENNGILYYVDYECNPYMDEWNFKNWGIWFYANQSGFAKFIENENYNEIIENGKPIKNGLENIVKNWLENS